MSRYEYLIISKAPPSLFFLNNVLTLLGLKQAHVAVKMYHAELNPFRMLQMLPVKIAHIFNCWSFKESYYEIDRGLHVRKKD